MDLHKSDDYKTLVLECTQSTKKARTDQLALRDQIPGNGSLFRLGALAALSHGCFQQPWTWSRSLGYPGAAQNCRILKTRSTARRPCPQGMSTPFHMRFIFCFESVDLRAKKLKRCRGLGLWPLRQSLLWNFRTFEVLAQVNPRISRSSGR